MDMKVTVLSSLDENYCVVMPRNFETVFIFWKFSNYKISQFKNGEYSKNIMIKFFDENKNPVLDISVPYDAAKYYITLPRHTASITASLYLNRNNSYELLSNSNEISLSFEKNLKKEYNYIR